MAPAAKLIAITGAASGIGRALAREQIRRGACVAAIDLDETRLSTVVSELGANARGYVCDISDPAQTTDTMAKVLREQGDVDVLVNNAGVAVVAPLVGTTSEDWKWILGVNLMGAIGMTRALVPAMIDRGRGHVAFVASLAGLVGAPGMVAYTTTKFGIVGFAESLRYELADAGIGITVACPGYVRTDLHRNTRYRNDGFRAFLDRAPRGYGVTAERAASRIADAIEARRFLVTFGPEAIGWYLKRLDANLAFAATRWVARRTGVLNTPPRG
jgi:NAD(P)-dependent dehydrogenase (short-subunit alcohol dehydrogenase family)